MTQKYIPTKWVANETIGTANVMNNIEQGIIGVYDEIERVDSQLAHIVNDGDTIQGNFVNKKLYSNNNCNVLSNGISINNGEIDNLKFGFSSTEGVVFKENSENIKIKNSTLDGDMCIHINNKNIKNIDIINNIINSKGFYPLLINYNTNGGKNLLVKNNRIKTPTGDGIEINTPTSETNGFENIIIDGNFIDCGFEGSAATSGFGIGIAQGKKCVVINNMITGSRQEMLHIEDSCDGVNVSNNMFYNGNGDGARILNSNKKINDLKTKPINITSNIFKRTSGRNKTGIYTVYDTNERVDRINLQNNIIYGYNIGLNLDNSHYGNNVIANCDGIFIENCNIGVKSNAGVVTGNIVCSNCDTLVSIGGLLDIESITTLTPIEVDNFYENRVANNTTSKIRKFNLRLNEYQTTTGTIRVPLFKLPTYFKGTLEAKLRLKNSTNWIHIISNVEYKKSNGTLTSDKVHAINYGVYSDANFVVENGYLCFSYWTSNTNEIMEPVLNFDGVYLISAND